MDDRRLDSYQNLICSPTGDDAIEPVDAGRDSVGHVSHVGGYMEVATIYVESGARWSDDEDAERIASDLSAGPGEDDRRRQPRPVHASTPRAATEPGAAAAAQDETPRAANGEAFKDDADDASSSAGRP